MIPVTQTVEGKPFGNCVQASYATLLGLPLYAVPRFDPAACESDGREQRDRERAWLASIGLDLVEVSTGDPYKNLEPEFLRGVPQILASVGFDPKMPHLMSGISPRGFGHRCVGVAGRLVWDPHPSHEGLLTLYSIGILVPL